MAATIKWLEGEIARLQTDIAENRRQADRFQTQANYQESVQPDISAVSEQTADKYSRDAESLEAQIADYRRQVEDLNRQVGQLEEERDELRRKADDIDRQIINLVG